MTTIEIKLPDELAQRAKSAGLLSDMAIQGLLEDAVRRYSGRMLLDVAKRIRAAEIPAMSEDEIVAEVTAVRAEHRSRQTGTNLPAGPPRDDDASGA